MLLSESASVIFSESPGKISLRTLTRDKRTWISLTLLLIIVLMSLFASFYAHSLAKTDTFVSTLNA
jgi:ABC-type microcin C transport system permease subunit YejE